jgi:MerR family mercuric resistance operon transcriptional regulator
MQQTVSSQVISIGRLSARTGCKVETIRYYEKIGLIEPPTRSAGGYRQYDNGHVDRVAFIRRCRELGFSLARIEALLAMASDAANHTRAEVKQLVDQHVEDIDLKIKDLQKLSSALREIGKHCDGAPAPASDCPILDALSRAPGD